MRLAVDAINSADFTSRWMKMIAAGDRSRDKIVQMIDVGVGAFSFEQSFTPLARGDFDRALLLAQAIVKKELSALAQIAACRAVLIRPRPDESHNKNKATGLKDSGPPRKSKPPQV